MDEWEKTEEGWKINIGPVRTRGTNTTYSLIHLAEQSVAG